MTATIEMTAIATDDANAPPPRQSYSKPRRNWSDNHHQTQEEPKESAAERLAKMQAAASSIEEQRAERVREQEIKDVEEEDKNKKNMEGGRHFISKVRGQASSMGLGEAIARGRQNFTKEVDV